MQSLPRILKMLRENSNIKEKREALTYIRSNSRKLESTKGIKEEQYKELCKLIVDAFAYGNNDIQNEAYETLNVVIREFKDHTLNLFEAMSQISQKHRLKILKLLEVVEENAVSTFANDPHAVNIFNNCLCTIQTNTMPWIAPTACVDNIQALIEAESKQLSEDQRLQEETINYCITFLRRLYKIAEITSDIKTQRFNALLMDKVVLLAYMGHKRQRGPALKLLQQALATDIVTHVHTKLPNVWNQYVAALQSTYWKRMLLLVSACELDWATQWNISIQFLGMHLHRGASLINNLLSVEEKAFKSTDTIIRRQAFLSWKLLADNFALDPQELATPRRIKLLCIPLNAKNSKTESIALTKLEVWWHVIIKLYKDIAKCVNPVITQFLNFCFGPLGDTPFLSSKFDIIASPGKRFFKTKLVAVDALCQLLVTKQENAVFSAILEERLPHSITDAVFQQCYQSIIHSVGEALLVLSQLTDAEMKNRYQLGKILWTSLVNYMQESKMEDKGVMYKNIVSVITELTNYAGNKPMIKNLILDLILFEITDLSKNFNFQDDTLSGLLFKFLQTPSIMNETDKEHYGALKRLLWHCIKSQTENVYYAHAFTCLKKMNYTLHESCAAVKKETVLELWHILADVLGKYMSDIQEINEGTTADHNLNTVESIVAFPFAHLCTDDPEKIQEISKAWKHLYKQFEMRTDLMSSVKSNEILLNIASKMQDCLRKNGKSSSLIIQCLDVLLSTINYKLLLAYTEVPSIAHLLVELIIYFLHNSKSNECEFAIKALSSVIISIYVQSMEKVLPYLHVCKPAIESMLQTTLEELHKEVKNTWETVLIVFKGLDKEINSDLILLYKKAIIQALNHPYVEIQSQTLDWYSDLYESRNILGNGRKLLLEDIEKVGNWTRGQFMSKYEVNGKKKNQVEKPADSVKIVSSLQKSTSQKSTVKESDKKTSVDTKRISIDSDSQDYVLIKTDLKFDVNRLTEHQKESLKRRREDIQAIYTDLSQSSSQDTENLQEWFDKKSKSLEETEKGQNKKENSSIKSILDDDANKENKIEAKELEMISRPIEHDTKPVESVGQNSTLEIVQKVKSSVDHNENSTRGSQVVIADKTTFDIAETKPSADFVTKDVKSTNQEESSENREDQRLSPSMLDSGKRRSRYSFPGRSNTLAKSEDVASSQPGQSSTAQTLQRTRTKAMRSQFENLIRINKQQSLDNVENKLAKEDKRGTKRRSVLEDETEGPVHRQRRKITQLDPISDDDSVKSAEQDSAPFNLEDMSQVDKRTRKEMHRLRINMIFDSPLSTCRRSKAHEDNTREVTPKRQSPELKNSRSKIPEPKGKSSKPARMKKPDKTTEVKKVDDVKKSSPNKKNETDEARSEESNSSDSKSSNRTQETDIESGLADENIQIENDTEDIIEDSQLLKLDKNRICNINKVQQNVDISKTESAKEALKSNDMLETEAEEKRDDENVQEEKISKMIHDDKSKDNGKTVSNDKLSNVIEDINEDISKESQTQSQADTKDIIESSQELSGTDKKSNDVQCMIKTRKVEHTSPSARTNETVVEDREITDIDLNCDNDNNEVPRNSVKAFDEVNEVCTVEPKISTHVIETSPCDNEKDVAPETQKINDPSTSKISLDFPSPKSNVKRQMKFKPYSGQGRAAHMLGLVTKQARMEAEANVITLDDAPPVKKTKGKDTENDTVLSKKEQATTLKETDKVTTACSSRQEKIFSNMRSADYCSSPSMKLFSSLKNDGEKFFSKDKSIDCIPLQTEAQIDKSSDETSAEAVELPILEWSSANPPSLTASPSASILKRQRQSFPEPDPESTTPSKRKRVSFADPPVSKEMGYETTESPHKSNKFASRSLLMRKDSPFRLKHTKHRMMSIDLDKLDNTEDVDPASTTEVDLQCERENEMLTKIAEELEYTECVMDTQTLCGATENESTSANTHQIKMEKLSGEFQVTEGLTFSKRVEATTAKKDEILEMSRNSNSSLECNELDDSKTQEDIFAGKHTEHDYSMKISKVNSNLGTAAAQTTTVANSIMLDSLKFNVENESIIEHSSEKRTNSENLEDTVDAANLTGLNSSANSDEIFCNKLMRTSTQTSENIQDQDTLPVTDSVFASLPLSQESSNEFNVEIPHPELLDSIHPIYPALTSCKKPVATIIDHLTYPLWAQNLSAHLMNKNIQTIGDLARLSEREINRIPVKGNSKVEFVKSILKCFEKMCTVKETTEDSRSDKVSFSVNTNVPTSTPKEMLQDNETQNNSVNNSILVSQPSSHIFESMVVSEKNAAEMSKDVDITECILQEPGPSKAVTGSVTESAVNSSTPVSNATPVTPKTKTVGTCTSSDSVYFSKTVANKATKSVAAQMALADLLDEIDVNLVLESAARRCSPEKLLLQYKDKMRHVPQVELETETLKVLSSERINYNEVTLKAACRACGVNKVLLRLPDIFSADKEFFVKVLNTYKKKIRASDCLNILDFNEIKDAVCEKCTTSEIADMFSKKLQDEEQQGTRNSMTELPILDSYLLLKRMPMDVIISNTVANDELIPSAVVLDIALQNNSANVIAQALKSQSPSVMKTVFDALWSPEFAAKHMLESSESKEDLLKIFKEVSSKLSKEDLLQAFYESMNAKLLIKEKKN
ncbi:telomere-associated protein RIF1-like [Ceratina calcarata]|uniref:Telomere-associated protein RIF1-like n=1 Tax=Ceratina calcarata TaxID=156304 RepID=A0AAJ7ISZ1_9HYME|nr:telomere-associated protein RIF1-like [Ceratina calcarata]